MGWDRYEDDWWPAVTETLPKPWPREAALCDLRWWAGQVRRNGSELPSRRALCRRWGWTEWAVRTLLRSGWEDSHGGIPPNLRPTSAQPPPNLRPTSAQPDDMQPKESDENRPTSAQPPPNLRPTSAQTSPHARLSTPTPTPTPTPIEQTHVESSPRSSRLPAGAFDRVQEFWRSAKPSGPKLVTSRGDGKTLAARIREHGEAPVVEVMDWALNSDHGRAKYLRDNGYCRLSTLMRASKFEGYLEQAREAQGPLELPRGGHAGIPDEPTDADWDEYERDIEAMNAELAAEGM